MKMNVYKNALIIHFTIKKNKFVNYVGINFFNIINKKKVKVICKNFLSVIQIIFLILKLVHILLILHIFLVFFFFF